MLSIKQSKIFLTEGWNNEGNNEAFTMKNSLLHNAGVWK